MSVPSYVWITLGIVAGIVAVYFLCLKLADNDWIGNRPTGPRNWPFLRCASYYFSSKSLLNTISGLFVTYGDIFALCFFAQKVVFLKEKQILSKWIKKSDVKPITLRIFAKMLSNCGFYSFSDEELEFLEQVWKKIQQNRQEEVDESLEVSNSFATSRLRKSILQIVDLLQTADYERSVNQGELQYTPKSLSLMVSAAEIRMSASSDRLTWSESVESGVKELSQILINSHNIGEVLLPRPHIWMSELLSKLPTHFFFRKRILSCMSEIRTSVEKILLNLGTRCELNYLAFLIILFVHHQEEDIRETDALHSQEVSTMDNSNDCLPEADFGVNLSGYRLYRTLDYITLLDFTIPKYTFIVSCPD